MAAGDDGGDLFSEAHKGLRYALFEVMALVGRADGVDDVWVQRVEDEWRDVAMVLDLHQQCEDQYCGPLVREHAAHLVDPIDQAHREVDEAIDRADAIVGRLVAAPPARRPAILAALYAQLGALLAGYLAHLNHEEETVLPTLRNALGPDGLRGAAGQMHRGMAPDDRCVFLRYLVPGLNPAERVSLLSGLQRATAADTFEQFRKATEVCLPVEEYRALSAAAALA